MGAEAWAGDRPWKLRVAGFWITGLLISASGLAGWGIERLARGYGWIGLPLLLMALASCLAGRSLERAVRAVLEAPSLAAARERLAWIVGRDVDGLEEPEILRAAAETAAENAVDGLFGPLFWMLVGGGLWAAGGGLPGPLALGWIYKAASTLDSMLGYRRGRLLWLGTAGARLDDLLTWLPCRLVAVTLPLVSGNLHRVWPLLRLALREGAADPSPNAGVSQAAFAQAAATRLGGPNRYGGRIVVKPVLGGAFPAADREAVGRILGLTRRLQLCWLGISGLGFAVAALAAGAAEPQ
jgi:adenosylcobinamide-phosphate synthase